MKIYVAGKWGDKAAIRRFMDRLCQGGKHSITEDWTQHTEGKKTSEELEKDALCDVGGIAAADVVIALMTDPTYPYRGTFFELGFALGSFKRVILLAHTDQEAAFRKVAFFHLKQITVVENEEEVLALLVC